MMREKDEITDLFRSRLGGAGMTVRDNFWEELQCDLSRKEAGRQKRILLSPRFCRVAAAASVVFVLGAASAAFWYFSPKEEIKEAFTQVAALTPEGSLKGDVVQESFPSIHQTDPTANKPGIKQPANGAPAGLVADADEESVSLHVSITITQRVYGNNRQPGNGYCSSQNSARNGMYQADSDCKNTNPDMNTAASGDDKTATAGTETTLKPRYWAIKAAVGTSLPQSNFDMPFTAGVTVERRLNKYLALETGLQYNCLPADHTLHTLAVPVKLNAMLASSPKVDFYATLGGAIEKCIAGAPDNSFKAEPVQLSVVAGVGVRYKVNDRFALFAEPSVSHHFDTDSPTKSLRTERPVNLNLLCGVRMTY